MSDPMGSLERNADRYTLRFKRTVPHPVDKVWRALTDRNELAAWFPATIVGFGEPGSTLEFRMSSDPGQLPNDELGQVYGGEVTAFEPPRLLEYTWDDDLLRWELQDTADGTLIVFTHVFDDQGRGARDASGWHFTLEALENLLTEAAPPHFTPEVFDELFDDYKERFGDDAARLKAGD